MARPSRLAIAGQAHHVTQRSVGQQPAFIDDIDRATYLSDLRQAARDCQVTLQAYVLMTDHVHLVATPSRREGLGQMMQRIGRRYVAYFNRRHQRSGALWDGRFRAAVLDPEQFVLCCLAHIERNPLRHRLVERPEEWPWSSVAHHLGLACDPTLVNPPAYWQLGNTPFERESAYRHLLEGLREDDPDVQRLRTASRSGRAVGSEAFLRQMRLQCDAGATECCVRLSSEASQPVPTEDRLVRQLV